MIKVLLQVVFMTIWNSEIIKYLQGFSNEVAAENNPSMLFDQFVLNLESFKFRVLDITDNYGGKSCI